MYIFFYWSYRGGSRLESEMSGAGWSWGHTSWEWGGCCLDTSQRVTPGRCRQRDRNVSPRSADAGAMTKLSWGVRGTATARDAGAIALTGCLTRGSIGSFHFKLNWLENLLTHVSCVHSIAVLESGSSVAILALVRSAWRIMSESRARRSDSI